MEQFVIDASIPTSYELKFAPHSHQGHNILAAMSGRDIQIFEMKKDEGIIGGFSQKYKLRSFYEVMHLYLYHSIRLSKPRHLSGLGTRTT